MPVAPAASSPGHLSTVALVRAGWTVDVEVIWVKSEPEYFCEWGWTGDTLICPSRQTQSGCSGQGDLIRVVDAINSICMVPAVGHLNVRPGTGAIASARL